MAIALISTLLLHFKANIRDISVTIFRVVIFMSYVGKHLKYFFALHCCAVLYFCVRGHNMTCKGPYD